MMCNYDYTSLGCVVMRTWSSSEKVEKVDAFYHPPAPWNALFLLCLASPCLWLFSGSLQLITAAHVCITAPFPTEGKQMRSNVNSRLLMQHCAKMCAPAAQIECAPLLHPFCMAEIFSPGSEFLFRPIDEKKKTIVHTHYCVHTCDAILAKHRGLPPTLYQL